MSLRKCYKTSCYHNNAFEKGDNNEFECISTCSGDLNYFYRDNVNGVAKCLSTYHEPLKFHDVENNLCLSQCPYNKKYYAQDFYLFN